jgi:hypothetical protein
MKAAKEKADTFECTKCKHGGRLSAWPEFPKEQLQLVEEKPKKSYKELISDELICYHTKEFFNQKGQD